MRYLVVLLAIAGCSAYPGEWNACISAGEFAGDRITDLATRRVGVVKRVYGASPRCSDERHPNLAEVAWK